MDIYININLIILKEFPNLFFKCHLANSFK